MGRAQIRVDDTALVISGVAKGVTVDSQRILMTAEPHESVSGHMVCAAVTIGSPAGGSEKRLGSKPVVSGIVSLLRLLEAVVIHGGYLSAFSMVTERISSPTPSLWTTSRPSVVWPNTVYWPSRNVCTPSVK